MAGFSISKQGCSRGWKTILHSSLQPPNILYSSLNLSVSHPPFLPNNLTTIDLCQPVFCLQKAIKGTVGSLQMTKTFIQENYGQSAFQHPQQLELQHCIAQHFSNPYHGLPIPQLSFSSLHNQEPLCIIYSPCASSTTLVHICIIPTAYRIGNQSPSCITHSASAILRSLAYTAGEKQLQSNPWRQRTMECL